MILFFSQSTEHLAQNVKVPKAAYLIKQFSDGEIYIKIDTQVQGKEVWVITSTQPPAENILELFFLLDALVRSGAHKINLFFSYFGYARQVVALPGEAGSAQLICDMLQKFPLNKIYIIHVHAASLMHTFLPFTNLIDTDFFCAIAKEYDVIAAPDKGALVFAQEIATTCNKEVVLLEKTRPAHEEVRIEAVNGIVAGKKVLLVDDIIATGRTLIEACQALKKLGALEVSAAATHGIFSNGAIERLAHSPLKKIYVTNTLKQHATTTIQVRDISTFIESILKR